MGNDFYVSANRPGACFFSRFEKAKNLPDIHSAVLQNAALLPCSASAFVVIAPVPFPHGGLSLVFKSIFAIPLNKLLWPLSVLNFMGNTEEAFNFYKSVFGGEFLTLSRFKDQAETANVPENEKNMIMHVALPISNDVILMGTDTLESMGQQLNKGNNVSLAINTTSLEETEKLFNGLSAGGKVTMPLEKTFWGAYFGMFTDKFGIQWMVNYDLPRS